MGAQAHESFRVNESLLNSQDFNKPFQINRDASHRQSSAVMSQDGKPTVVHRCKLNPTQACHVAQRELFGMAKTLKEHPNMILCLDIEGFANHKWSGNASTLKELGNGNTFWQSSDPS